MDYKTLRNLADEACALRYEQCGRAVRECVLSLYKGNYARSYRLQHLASDFSETETRILQYVKFDALKRALFNFFKRGHYKTFDIILSALSKLYKR